MDSAWRGDLFRFAPHRTVDVAHGSSNKRKDIIGQGAEFVIINYDGVKIIADDIANGGFDLIIVDEATHYKNAHEIAKVSTGLGAAMVGISDIKNDAVNFRDREGGEGQIPKKRKLVGATETQLYGSSWNVH